MSTIPLQNKTITAEQLEENWAADREERAEPQKLTRLFHRSVPILKHLNWRVLDTGRGFAETILPISIESTNQHITHQAAIMLIAADYTGGIALGTLLHAVPLVGIHPQATEYGAYLWGAKADIKWIRPSTEDLLCSARIAPELHAQIIGRFFSGRRVLETVRVEMKNGSQIVAEANLTYWVQDTDALRQNAFDEDKVHPLYDHRHKTSASLIAGLRAIEHNRPHEQRLLEDSGARSMAGERGIVLAQRFSMVAPQIQPMVVSRTLHLDDVIAKVHAGRRCQLVNVGVGLCSRIFRIELPAMSKVFDLDLPIMLRTRREALAESGYRVKTTRIEVPVDLRNHNIAECVLNCADFDPKLPTVVIWEGGSMYFDPVKVSEIINATRVLLEHPDSRLWFDYVSQSVVNGSSEWPVVHSFMDAMRSLGEPFTCGFDDISPLLGGCGMEPDQETRSGIHSNSNDPVFGLYKFAVCRALA